MSPVRPFIFLLVTSFIFCQISILSPQELASRFPNSTLNIVFGTLGTELYEFTARGRIYLETVTPYHTGCGDLDELDLYQNSDITESYKILLVNHGGCSVVRKAREAQRIGASMLLIISKDNSEIDATVLADDGTGGDINIQVAMLSNREGKALEDYIVQKPKEKLVVDVDFVETNQDKLEIKFFFSSSEPMAYPSINDLTNSLKEFGNKVKFTPVYVSHIHPFYLDNEPTKMKNCVSKGKYCYFPKETTIQQDGVIILIESIRQKCFYTMNKKKPERYIDYMNKFYEHCINIEQPRLNENCEKETLRELGYEKTYLDLCLAKSFGVDKPKEFRFANMENPNVMLEQDYKKIIQHEITNFPAVMVGSVKMQGAIALNDVLKELCNQIAEKPNLCLYYQGKAEEVQSTQKKSIAWLIILLILVNLGVFFLCRKYIIKRVYERINSGNIDIDGQINNVIGNYFSLKDSSSKSGEKKGGLFGFGGSSSSSSNSSGASQSNSGSVKTYEASGSHSLPEVAIEAK